MSRFAAQGVPGGIFLWVWLLAEVFPHTSAATAQGCDQGGIVFRHLPSDYYGSGEYFAQCPETEDRIRCYHYHRHWICQKGDTRYWDRNLDSAARTACGCPLPPGRVPSSPAVSMEPASRFPGLTEGAD